jgi:FlaA1/EpsC-like NDP-sugar epimerase
MPPFTPTGRKRTLFFVLADLVVFTVSMYGAFLLRFDGHVPEIYWAAIPVFLLFAAGPKLIANAAFRLYYLTWRFVGTRDIINVFFATVVGTLAWVTEIYLLRDTLRGRGWFDVPPIPRSVIVLDFVLTLFGVSLVRMSKRLFQVATRRPSSEQERRVLIVGAGAEGEALLRELTHARMAGYRLVALIAEARARFSPSTVISTVAPRETPCGDTELMVGGVMRVPVGESAVCWANIALTTKVNTRIDLMSNSHYLTAKFITVDVG